MADLFEEYGALEYKKPKKKLKLPKLPVPPKWILWLGIAAVIIGAVVLACWLTKDAPFWMTEEERTAQTLEKCEKALTKYQSLDSRYVHWEMSSGKDCFLYDHWRCGEDIYLISTLGDALSEGHLRKGDEQYYFGAAQMWETRTFEDGYLDILWLDTYSWNEEDITLLSQKTAGAGEEITLQIEGPVDPDKRAFRDMENYTVCMRLDEAGTLTAVTLSYTIRNYEETQIYQINSVSQEEAARIIEDAYLEITSEIDSEYYPTYVRFVQVLEEFRSLKRYQVSRKTESQGGESLTNYAETTYWRCGEDFLKETWIEESQTRMAWVQKGDVRYGGNYDSERGKMVWGVLYGGENLTIPWLETYEPGFQNVLSAREQTVGSLNLILVVFQGDPFSQPDSGVEKHSVCLTVDENGVLTNVDLVYADEGGGMRTSMFQIISTDWTEIEKTIDKAYEEAAQYPESLVFCKDALYTFRNGENWCVVRETALNGVIISRSQYWTCGRDSMMQVWDVKEFNAFCYLQKEGLQFKLEYSLLSSSSDPLQWELTAFPEGYFCIPWLENIPWDYHETELVREEVAADGKRITINIPQDPMGIAKDSMEFCYELDQDGVLRSVTATYSTQNGTIVDTFQIASTDKEEIAKTIYEAYEEAVLQIKVG